MTFSVVVIVTEGSLNTIKLVQDKENKISPMQSTWLNTGDERVCLICTKGSVLRETKLTFIKVTLMKVSFQP